MILFLKLLEFVKVVKYAEKCAKICILMVSFILCVMSQVEHTKKRNSIDSESKSVKQNQGRRNVFTTSPAKLDHEDYAIKCVGGQQIHEY